MDSVNNGAGDHGGGVIGGSHDHGGGLVSGSGVDSLRVLGLAVIGHIGHVSIIAIGAVVDMLDPAVGKSHGVRSLGIAGTVRALRLLEVGLGVVIGHGVGEGVGGGLGQVISHVSGLDGGVVSGGVDNRGGVGGGAIDGGMGGGGGGHKGRDTSDDLDRGETLDYGEYSVRMILKQLIATFMFGMLLLKVWKPTDAFSTFLCHFILNLVLLY